MIRSSINNEDGLQCLLDGVDAVFHCAAELKISMAGECEYCGSKLTSGQFDWVLSEIQQDEEYAG